ncbi:MAG: preprotein translocase subunit YajC [Verrucomicrobiota bacterium]
MIENLCFILAQAPAGAPPQNPLQMMVPFIAIAVIFYFLIIRPQQKRQKEQAAIIASVKTGDKVVLNSGMHGIVANVKETTILVKVADNVKIEFDKAAVASVTKSAQEA